MEEGEGATGVRAEGWRGRLGRRYEARSSVLVPGEDAASSYRGFLGARSRRRAGPALLALPWLPGRVGGRG